MTLKKPKSIQENEYKSKKWDELTAGRKFKQSDIPALELLCSWHTIAQKCMRDLDNDVDIEVAYSNDYGDVKALPQISTMKQASAEIRTLNKQLGINDEVEDHEKSKTKKKISAVTTIRGKRNAKSRQTRESVLV